MNDESRFRFFDSKAEISIRRGDLPHWSQLAVTFFVTMCLRDSVPGKLIRRQRTEIVDWAVRHGFDPRSPSWRDVLSTQSRLAAEYRRYFRTQYERWLDEGYGSCLLADPQNSEIIVSAMRYFEGSRSILGPFVVMPNHLHALVAVVDDRGPDRLGKSWRRYSAVHINRRLGRQGSLWQEEGFDHLVRSPDSFVRFRDYILENPRRAGLKAGQYRIGDGSVDGFLACRSDDGAWLSARAGPQDRGPGLFEPEGAP
mgnify:CR=1 FL=1